GSEGAWTFYVSNGNETGYLSASSSSSNNMKTVQTADNKNAQATISISSGSATIKFQGSYSRNLLKYNTGSPRFTCYQSTSTGTQFPQIYRQVKVEIEDVPGDVNKDGKVTVADVTALVNILLGQDANQTLYNHEAADVDGQEGVTIEDIPALINLVLQQ
ncbi:MAG: dockerin type I repeat-containing protein, partial [Prevotella sp.]|nr:dockerin type I repeat-containing protein [Prevotella sp.]